MGELMRKVKSWWDRVTGKASDRELRGLLEEWHGMMEVFAQKIDNLEEGYDSMRQTASDAKALAESAVTKGSRLKGWLVAAVVLSGFSIALDGVLLFIKYWR